MYTDSYHLHVTTLEIAMEASISRWLGLEFSVATAIAIVYNIVDRNLLLGIHDSSRRCGEAKDRGRYGGE